MFPVLPSLPPTLSALAAEPASILYIFTGAVALAATNIRKARRSSATGSIGTSNESADPIQSSTAMLFCQPSSRETLKELKLL